MTQNWYDCTCRNLDDPTKWEPPESVLAPSPQYAAEAFAVDLAQQVGIGETLIVKVGERQYRVTTTCHWRAKSVPITPGVPDEEMPRGHPREEAY